MLIWENLDMIVILSAGSSTNTIFHPTNLVFLILRANQQNPTNNPFGSMELGCLVLGLPGSLIARHYVYLKEQNSYDLLVTEVIQSHGPSFMCSPDAYHCSAKIHWPKGRNAQ